MNDRAKVCIACRVGVHGKCSERSSMVFLRMPCDCGECDAGEIAVAAQPEPQAAL